MITEREQILGWAIRHFFLSISFEDFKIMFKKLKKNKKECARFEKALSFAFQGIITFHKDYPSGSKKNQKEMKAKGWVPAK